MIWQSEGASTTDRWWPLFLDDRRTKKDLVEEVKDERWGKRERCNGSRMPITVDFLAGQQCTLPAPAFPCQMLDGDLLDDDLASQRDLFFLRNLAAIVYAADAAMCFATPRDLTSC